jgi:uncharacterized phage-like protein YoqJ
MIISFTGHRLDKLPNKETGYNLPNPTYNYVCQEIEKNLKLLNPEKAISGMALGVDQWGAFISHRLGIPFIAAVPFEGQEKKWPAKSQKIYHKLISLAAEVIIVSPGGYSVEKMQIRNQFMVDRCDKLIAIYNGDKSGGTANCVNYGKSINKEIIIIDPTVT